MADLTDEIGAILEKKQNSEERKSKDDEQTGVAVERFMKELVRAAFDEFAEALRAHGRDVEINVGPRTASFLAKHEGKEELNYRVEHQRGTKVAPVVTFTDRSDGKRYSGLGYFRSGPQDYGVADLTKAEIVQHMMNEYRMMMSPRP